MLTGDGEMYSSSLVFVQQIDSPSELLMWMWEGSRIEEPHDGCTEQRQVRASKVADAWEIQLWPTNNVSLREEREKDRESKQNTVRSRIAYLIKGGR